MLSTVLLQKILLPETPEMQECEELFFRSGLSKELPEDRFVPEDRRWAFSVSEGKLTRDDRMLTSSERHTLDAPAQTSDVRYDAAANCLVVPAGQLIDLSCYLNMISARKWLRTTFVENITLELEIEGDALIDVVAYQLDDFDTLLQLARFNKRRETGAKESGLKTFPLTSMSHSSAGRTTVTMPMGHPDATLAGVVVTAKTETRIYGGSWLGSVDSADMREVNLCISTTTFQKEEFITRNVKSIKDMLAEYPEMADHFQMLVIDNGRTLNPADLEDEHVSVFGNINAGGSGGFARGMIEAMRAPKKPTHLLLMDDDVLILTESIRRAYTLLTLLRPEYHDQFLSGAMLRLENKDIQHEDIGFIHRDGFYAPKKSVHSLHTILDCACNEVDWPDFGYEYAGWWFCCIPMKYITEDNLPFPFFIKVDDAEYSIRNDAKVLTMNGICVWHMGFTQKFSAAMDYHQVTRNSLAMRAFEPLRADIDFPRHLNMLTNQLLSVFAYDYVDLVLDAFEDYLEGPSIFEKPNGVEIIKEKSKRNEVLEPLESVWPGEANFEELLDRSMLEHPTSILKRKTVTFSHNGQSRLQAMVSDELGFAPHDWEYNHESIFMKKNLLVVNPGNLTAIMRERDPQRYEETLQRKEAVFKRFEEEHERVDEAYREAFCRFTNIDFWKQYLGID